MGKRKVKAYLFYKNKNTEIQEFDYENEFHLGNYLVGVLIIADERGRTPDLAVAEVDGKYHSCSVAEHDDKRR